MVEYTNDICNGKDFVLPGPVISSRGHTYVKMSPYKQMLFLPSLSLSTSPSRLLFPTTMPPLLSLSTTPTTVVTNKQRLFLPSPSLSLFSTTINRRLSFLSLSTPPCQMPSHFHSNYSSDLPPNDTTLSSTTTSSSSTQQASSSSIDWPTPVIGILSHPGDGASGRLTKDDTASNIAASYVRFVQSADARVIPFIYNEPREILHEKLKLVNGFLFTGGWCKSGLYFDVVGEIFENVLKKNEAGDHCPLYAICLGFELLTMIISKDNNILESFIAHHTSTLEFIKNTTIQGTVFERFPPDLLKKLSTDCLVMQNHRYGISAETIQENKELSSFFKVLTTSVDENDKVYVSTVQAYGYPVTAFQWHPEKNAFEWGSSRIPHSEDVILVTQHAANYFISEARKSLNRPDPKKVRENLIYNYSPTYCGKAGKGYDEVYIFTQPPTPPPQPPTPPPVANL